MAKRSGPGILDLIAAIMCSYAMVISTPVGEILVRVYRNATRSGPSTRELISYFDTGGGKATGTEAMLADAVVSRPETDSGTSIVARRLGMPPSLARAVAVLASNGKVARDGHLDVRLSAGGIASFRAVGAALPAPELPASDREQRFLEGISKLKEKLGGNEAAVAATVVEIAHVEFALDRARAAGVANPMRYESFRPFLPAQNRDDADTIVNGSFALSIAFDMRSPLVGDASISSPFGERIHPVLQTKKMHNGCDFAVPTGSEIRAVADGDVIYSASDSVNGRFVKLDHGHGLTTAYLHASELIVPRRAHVLKGDLIARSGATGRATGPHLHFQVELNGKSIDPELFLRAKRGKLLRQEVD